MKLMEALFAALILGGASAAHARPAARRVHAQTVVTVSMTDYKGWHNCWKISNGLVDAIVVPQIGRIMAFQFVRKPDTNALFNNADLLGKTGYDRKPGDWGNFGGDKVWPSPQSSWEKYIGAPWPPDVAFDGRPHRAERLASGIRLFSGRSAAFGLQVIRTITMRPGEPRLSISQEIHRFKSPSPTSAVKVTGATDADALGIWSITQIRSDCAVFMPMSPHSRFPSGFTIFDGKSLPMLKPLTPPTGWAKHGASLVGRRDPKDAHKVGSDAPAGWIAALYDGNVVFAEHYRNRRGAAYPDGGCRTEVWSNPGDTAYLELEVLGPMRAIPLHGSEHYDVTWELSRVPRSSVASDTAAERHLRRMLR